MFPIVSYRVEDLLSSYQEIAFPRLLACEVVT
jgi:hypothetical protein